MNILAQMRNTKKCINPQRTEDMIIGHPRKSRKIPSHLPRKLHGSEKDNVMKAKSMCTIVAEASIGMKS